MYTNYYGFREKPFALSPDPRFLYLSASHREVLGHLVYGIEQGEGFMAITGEVGTGKTTLCRTLLHRLGSESEVAFLFNPSLSPLELLKAINAEFDLSVFGDSKPELVEVLNVFLLDKRAEGRRVLLIVDEAQNLSSETLEELRLLSNLETETSKLLQIVLLGQPELDQKLAQRELRQLRQRISVWWRLGAMDAGETREYVQHRLRVAGAVDRPIFTEAALRAVHRLSGGVPRVINLLCDRALLAGYAEQEAQIGPALLKRAAAELRPAPRLRWSPRALPAAAAALAVALVGGWLALRAARGPDVAAEPPAAVDASTAAPGALPGAPAAAPPEPPAAGIPTPEPPASPLPPGLDPDDVLQALLLLQTPEQTLAAALDATLQAWHLPPSGREAVDLAELTAQLERRQLRLLPVATDLQSLAQAATPVLVTLRDHGGAERTALLRHLSTRHAELEGVAPDGRGVRISTDRLLRHLVGPAHAVWRDFENLPPLLRSGDQGEPVRWLQESLASLDYYRREIHGRFDDWTRDAVARFQRDQGLQVDGAVGPLTQMRLYEALPRYVTPSLALDAVGVARAK